MTVSVQRLQPGDERVARALFAVMTTAFEEDGGALSDAYLARLLARPDLWILAATDGDAVLGGLTAHVLPMTRAEAPELFVYDVAVGAEHQRRGVGRALVAHVRALAHAAGASSVFVLADDEDDHALAFYRAVGGEAAPVTMFSFAPRRRGSP